VLLLAAIAVLAVLDNGLEATAITEFAGPFWSGRALGIQNTTQRLLAAGGPPLFGVLITASAYPPAWALCGLFPLLAAPLVPVDLLPPGSRTTPSSEYRDNGPAMMSEPEPNETRDN
jgi:MFS family permease